MKFALSLFSLSLLLLPFAKSQPAASWEFHGPGQGMGMAFHAIHEGQQGFIWCASSNGLYRYDGYGFKAFKKYVTHNGALTSDYIWDIKESSNGDIWLATYDGGINKWDRKSGTFTYYRHEAGAPHNLSADRVLQLLIDRSGAVWAIVQGPDKVPVLDKLSPVSGKVAHYRQNKTGIHHIPNDTLSVTALAGLPLSPILEDKSGRIWVSSSAGLSRYLPEEDAFEPIPGPWESSQQRIIHLYESPNHPSALWLLAASEGLRSGEVYRLNTRTLQVSHLPVPVSTLLSFAPTGITELPEAPGQLWLASREICRLDLSTGTYKRYLPTLETSPALKQGIRDSLLCLYPGPEGQDIWALPMGRNPVEAIRGSENYHIREGIYRLNRTEDSLFFLDANPTSTESSFGMAYSISKSRDGSLWIGAFPGFYQIKGAPRGQRLNPDFQNIPLAEKGKPAANLSAWDAVELPDGSLWIATFRGGVKKLLPGEGGLVHYPHQAGNPASPGSNNTFSIYLDRLRNRIWIGHDKGLDWISLEEAGPGPSFHHLDDIPQLRGEPVTEIARGPEGQLWIGTTRQGLLLFSPEEEKITAQFLPRPGEAGTISAAYINKVYTDRKNRLWVAPGMGGLCQATAEGEAYRFDCQLEGMYIVDIFDDGSDTLWLAAMNYGIVRYIPESGEYELWNMENKLSRNSVLGIEKDKSGNLWFTSLGISRYNLLTGAIQNFRKKEGILDTDPGRLFMTLRDGRMVYSSLNGQLQIFRPDEVASNRHLPRVAITGLRAYDRKEDALLPLSTGENIELAREIQLRFHQQPFMFEFVGLELNRPEGIRYATKLEGHEKEWHVTGSSRHARFTSVPPGSYEFLVRAANSQGLWAEQPARIRLIIKPPWWQTAWAYLAYSLLCAALLAGLYFLLRRRWKLQARLQEEMQEARRLKELDQVKTSIFTNITHEFRTPLTVISGMAERIREQPRQWLQDGTTMIQRNARQLLRLVNQLLDLSKLEAGSMKAHYVHGDVMLFLRQAIEPFEHMAREKHIRFQAHFEPGALEMDYDPEKLLQIASNLLSNAIKFTPEGGGVQLAVDRLQGAVSREQFTGSRGQFAVNGSKGTGHSTLPTDDCLLLTVTDTGIGIPEDQLDKVFGRFYQVDASSTRQAEGSGIGLALTRELVLLLGGEISAESEEGKGTSFRVALPIVERGDIPATVGDKGAKEVRIGEAGLSVATADTGGNASPAAQPDHRKENLLIVEDNADLRAYLHSILGGRYKLLLAADGVRGLQLAVQEVPDIIISDIMMPGMNGLELCRQLKEDVRTSHIPVILLTARTERTSRVEGLSAGAEAYLSKPFEAEELNALLASLLRNRRKLQEHYQQQQEITSWRNGQEEQFLKQAKEVVGKHISDTEFNVDGLCRELGMSRTQLHNKLKALTGRSTSLFIRRVRLEQARRMLLSGNGGRPISDIAYEVGFKDPNYFTRCFKAEFKKNPSEIRP